MPDPPEVIARLRRTWSLDFGRVRSVLAALDDGATVSDLVAASGLPRRDVETVLAEVTPDVRSSLTDMRRAATPDAPDATALSEQMAGLAAGLPASRWRLDHVPATAETMARRALYLAEQYELAGASVLCLGDHDLTSLAVGLVEPQADVAVVDVDERVLDHIAGSAAGAGLAVTTAWADLRLALPPSLVGSADLVFTDPPYTTEGMRLFLVRALEALRPSGHERLAFCFGTGERHLVKALEVQSLLGGLRLALEAMLPGFNRYDGAEAIGARSDLYICRPTRGARVGEPQRPQRSKRIYTRGPSAEESPERRLAEPVQNAARAAVSDEPAVFVGEGWTDSAVPLADYFCRVAAWATAARRGPAPYPGTPVVNTSPDFGGAALRSLLLSAPERAVLVVPRRHLADLSLAVVTVAYDVEERPAGPGGDPVVVVATRHDRIPAGEGESVLRAIVLHPGAKVVNAWRDALLAAGVAATKNEARAVIAAADLSPALRRLRPWELPITDLRRLAQVTAP